MAHAFTFWGFLVLGLTIIEAWGALYDQNFHIPLIGTWGVVGFLEDFFAVAVARRHRDFAIIRYKQAPERRQRASRFYGSHNRGRRGHPGDDRRRGRHAAALPRRADQHRGFPFQDDGWAAFASKALSYVAAQLGTDVNSGHRDRFMLAERRRHPRVPGAWSPTPSTCTSRPPRSTWPPSGAPTALGPLLPMESGGKPIDFEDPGRGRHLRPRQDRGLHLEGHAGHGHLHRVRSLPEPVSGVEHGQAAVPEARDHGPARPPVRQGPLRPRARRRPRRRFRTSPTPSRPSGTTRSPSPATRASSGPAPSSTTARWSARSRRAGSSTPTSCGAAPTAAPASSSARSTSSTSTTSTTCAATRCWSSPASRPRPA